MPSHYWRRAMPEYYALMDSLNRSALTVDEVSAAFDSLKPALKVSPTEDFADIRTLSADFLISHIDSVFAAYADSPWRGRLKFDDFCQYLLPYCLAHEKRELWTDYYSEKYRRWSQPLYRDYVAGKTTLRHIVDSINDTLRRVSPLILNFKQLREYSPVALDRIRSGACDNYVMRTVYLLRSLGIPSGMELAPAWGDMFSVHTWNFFIDGDGKAAPFMGSEQLSPNFAGGDFLFVCPKVFRCTFSATEDSPAALYPDEQAAGFFSRKNILDVTAEYKPVSDISAELTSSVAAKLLYICVFNNKEWIPVHWGALKGRTAVFKNMARGYVYLPAVFSEGRLYAVNCPLLLDSAGLVRPLTPDTEKLRTLHLTRKFHTHRVEDYHARMVGGRFEAANKPDFSDAVTLHSICDIPPLHFNTVDLNEPAKFR
jgi:hypothetical protein